MCFLPIIWVQKGRVFTYLYACYGKTHPQERQTREYRRKVQAGIPGPLLRGVYPEGPVRLYLRGAPGFAGGPGNSSGERGLGAVCDPQEACARGRLEGGDGASRVQRALCLSARVGLCVLGTLHGDARMGGALLYKYAHEGAGRVLACRFREVPGCIAGGRRARRGNRSGCRAGCAAHDGRTEGGLRRSCRGTPGFGFPRGAAAWRDGVGQDARIPGAGARGAAPWKEGADPCSRNRGCRCRFCTRRYRRRRNARHTSPCCTATPAWFLAPAARYLRRSISTW